MASVNRDELKRMLLKLLKEDEEFRYAVAGALGLGEVLEELRRLREEFSKRFEALEVRMLEQEKRLEALERQMVEQGRRLEALEKQMIEYARRLEALERQMLEYGKRLERLEEQMVEYGRRLEKLEEQMVEYGRRLEAVEKQLVEHSRVLAEHSRQLRAIWEKLEEHEKRLERIEEKLREHDERLEAIEREVKKHSEKLTFIEEKLVEHDGRLNELNRRVAHVEMIVGALAESMYSRFVWEELSAEIRARGERVEARRRNARINGEDVDLLVVTDRSVYVVEVKVKPKISDVGALLAKIEVVGRRYPGRRVVPVLAGAMIGVEVEEYARQKGVIVYAY